MITSDVVALRDLFALPGMKVLQFAFSGPENPFLPHQYPHHCVVYTGTHDNDTSRGWYEAVSQNEKDLACRYLGSPSGLPNDEIAWRLMRMAWASVAVYALAPMQDFLNLGSAARMNFPSRLGGNWEWRMDEQAISGELRDRVKDMNWLYQR